MPRAFSNGQTCLPRPPSPHELSIPDAIKRLTLVSRDLLLGLMEYSELTDEQVSLLYTAVVKEFFLTMEVFELSDLDVSKFKTFPDTLRDALESVLEKANSVVPTTMRTQSSSSLPFSFSSSTSTFVQPQDEEEELNRKKEALVDPCIYPISTSGSFEKGVEVSAEEINSLLTQLIQQLQSLYKSGSISSLSSTYPSSLPHSPSSSTFFIPDPTSTTYAQLSPSPKKFTLTSSSRSTSSLSLPSHGSSKANLSKSNSFSSPATSPYLFLEWSKNVKKIKFQYQKLDFPYLYHLFYTHFQCIPHSHSKLQPPKLYVYDFHSHIFYELEDVSELSCGSYLRMEPMTLSPIRIHSSVLDTSFIHAKHPLRAFKQLKKDFLQLKEDFWEFQSDHQQWCKELKDQWLEKLASFQKKSDTLNSSNVLQTSNDPTLSPQIISFIHSSSRLKLTSNAHHVYLISEQVRYDLCERGLLPNALWLEYLSKELINLETQCNQFQCEIKMAQQALSPVDSERLNPVLQYQSKLKEAEYTLMETQQLLKTMIDVQSKLERALELAQEQPWPKPVFHCSPSSGSMTPTMPSSPLNSSSTFLSKGLPIEVLNELKTVHIDSEHRVELIQAFEHVRVYQQLQIKRTNVSPLVKELLTKSQRVFPLEVLNILEANREKATQLLLKMIWDLKKEILSYNDEDIQAKVGSKR